MRLLFWSWISLIGTCYAQSNVRNPFACAHKHGSVQSQNIASNQTTQEQLSSQNSALGDASSEWRVIAEKDDTVIMQHRDGSIREITISKQ